MNVIPNIARTGVVPMICKAAGHRVAPRCSIDIAGQHRGEIGSDLARAHGGDKLTLCVLWRTRRASGDTFGNVFHAAEQRLGRGSGRQTTALFSGSALTEHRRRHAFACIGCPEVEVVVAMDSGQTRVGVLREVDALIQHGRVAEM